MIEVLDDSWVRCLARPRPLPDEIAHGYIARALRLNGFECAPDLRRFLGNTERYAARAGVKLRLPFDAIQHSGASIAGMDVATFVARHTLAPLRFAVQFKNVGPWAAARYHGGCMHLPRGKLYGCPRCAEEDIAIFGTVYLRRIHQVPGIDFCSEHNCSLTAKGAWPEVDGVTRLRRANPIDPCLKKIDPSTIAPLSRYEAACSALLSRIRPVPWGHFRKAIGALLLRRGMTLHTREQGMFMWPSVLAETYGSDWLLAMKIAHSAHSRPWARSSAYILAALVGALTTSVLDTQFFFDALDAYGETPPADSKEEKLLDDLLCPS